MKRNILLLVTFIAICSWGCQSDDTDLKALVNIILVDSPAKWDSVFVEIEGVTLEVQVKGRESDVQTFFLPYLLGDKIIDVSELVAGKALLLGRKELPTGKILGASLKLGTRHVLYFGGERYVMSLASATPFPVLLRKSWELESGVSYDLILDFDLESSIQLNNQFPLSYQLKPVVHAFSAIGTGELRGIISPVILQPALYAINQTDSLSTHINSSGSFLFRLAPGKYTLYVDPKDVGFKPAMILYVEVVAGKSTDLNKITLIPE